MSKIAGAIHLLLVVGFLACQLTDDSFKRVPFKPCVFVAATPPFVNNRNWKLVAPSATAGYLNYNQSCAYTMLIKTRSKHGNSMP
jgi:hypothetical protein